MKQKPKTSRNNSNKSRLLMALIIIFLMVFSVLGFVVVRETEGERVQYKQKTFSKANDKWLTYIDNKPLVISSSPKDLEQIQIPKVSLNDLNLAQGLLNISSDNKIKESLNYSKDITFFDWVIVSSYYSISHSSQALLGVKNIKINNRLHHATLVAFAKQFIINAELERELFLIYEDAEEKARELLEIFEKEKTKQRR